jgi:hypothetical protein
VAWWWLVTWRSTNGTGTHSAAAMESIV